MVCPDDALSVARYDSYVVNRTPRARRDPSAATVPRRRKGTQMVVVTDPKVVVSAQVERKQHDVWNFSRARRIGRSPRSFVTRFANTSKRVPMTTRRRGTRDDSRIAPRRALGRIAGSEEGTPDEIRERKEQKLRELRVDAAARRNRNWTEIDESVSSCVVPGWLVDADTDAAVIDASGERRSLRGARA